MHAAQEGPPAPSSPCPRHRLKPELHTLPQRLKTQSPVRSPAFTRLRKAHRPHRLHAQDTGSSRNSIHRLNAPRLKVPFGVPRLRGSGRPASPILSMPKTPAEAGTPYPASTPQDSKPRLESRVYADQEGPLACLKTVPLLLSPIKPGTPRNRTLTSHHAPFATPSFMVCLLPSPARRCVD